MRRLPWAIIALLLIACWAWSRFAAAPLPASSQARDSQAVHAPLATAPGARTGAGAHDQASARAPRTPSPSPSPSYERTRATPTDTASLPSWLPPEARRTLRLIAGNGPFPHRQDGATFGNREGRLPAQPRGYYREYTVTTPGSRDRGARRIVAGGDPPWELFYSEDHYRSFRRIPTAVATQ